MFDGILVARNKTLPAITTAHVSHIIAASRHVHQFCMTPALPSSLATASSALPIGMRLGEFEITGVLGEGGFGIVYSANDLSLDRTVAIKEYLPSALSYRNHQATVQIKSEEHTKTFAAGLASFVNEARLLASFSHPALVEVFRFWEAHGTAYMAMRYYPGATFLATLKANPQMATEAWLRRTLDPVLLALTELHAQQCYHRDIAPDNIMVLPDGRSVLMDFGAARRIIGGMSQAVTTVLKPGYAPIEQYAHDGAMHQGAWTDVYAVGSVLYQAMTGQTPVQAIARMGTDPLLAVGILSRQTSRATYSDQLCVCVMKSMAVQPASRFQTIQALRAALGWDQSQGPLHPVPPSFDPSATAVFGRTVNDKPIASAGSASAANKAFDPLATVVPARPATKTLVDPGAADTRSVQPMPKFGNAENVLAEKALSPTNARTALWAGLTAAGLAMAAGLIYLMGSPADPAASPPATVSSPPVPIAVEPVTAAPALAATVPGPTTPGPLLAAEPVAPIQAAASTPPMPAIPATSSEAAVLANPANPTANVAVDLPTTGVLRVEVKDGWAAVFVNGEDSGVAPPLMSLKLPPGSYDIELRNPALPTVKRSVKVVAGKTATLRHAFIKDTPPTAPAAPATPAYPAPSSAKPVTTY